MKLNINHAVKTFKHVVTANSPALLAGTAIIGVVTTGVLAAKGGYKARGILEEAVAVKGAELSNQEKFQLTWLCAAAPALTGVSTIGAIVGSHLIHTKRFAGMAGAYALMSNKVDDYQEKVEELLGPKKSQLVRDEVAQKARDRHGEIENSEAIMLDGGTELCHDDFAGRYFNGSTVIIDRAINKINSQLVTEDSASLNDFYEAIGLPKTAVGELVGWSGTKIEPRYGNAHDLTPDGKPSIGFWFQPEPKSDYWKTHR